MTYVDSNELNKLRQDASQLRALRQDLPERLENDIRQIQQSMENRLTPIVTRQREYERAILSLNDDIRQVEQGMAQRIAVQAQITHQALLETAENMERQRHELRQELLDTAQRLERDNQETEQRLNQQIHTAEKNLLRINEETRQEMHEQGERLTQAISKETQERELGLNAANQRIDAIHQDRDRLAKIARDQLHAAQTLHDFIAGHYRHEHFTPNKLSRLERAISSARNSLDLGASEAAIAEANSAYQNLSDLRLELEQLDADWRICREQALQTAGRLLAEAHANRTLTNVEGTGEITEANYWTGGKLAELEADIHTALNQAENERNPLSIAEMRRLVEKSLPDMDCRLDRIVEEAQIAVLRSQLCTNIADLIMQALIPQGYSEAGGVFEGEDTRNGFVMKARNRAGSEVVASVVPDGDRVRVTVDSFEPSPRTPGELLLRNREIAQVIRDQGLEASEPAMVSEAPSDANRDLDQVRKRKTKAVSR